MPYTEPGTAWDEEDDIGSYFPRTFSKTLHLAIGFGSTDSYSFPFSRLKIYVVYSFSHTMALSHSFPFLKLICERGLYAMNRLIYIKFTQDTRAGRYTTFPHPNQPHSSIKYHVVCKSSPGGAKFYVSVVNSGWAIFFKLSFEEFCVYTPFHWIPHLHAPKVICWKVKKEN